MTHLEARVILELIEPQMKSKKNSAAYGQTVVEMLRDYQTFLEPEKRCIFDDSRAPYLENKFASLIEAAHPNYKRASSNAVSLVFKIKK